MKSILFVLFGLMFILTGAVMFLQRNDATTTVVEEILGTNGEQVLELTAKGGYSPSLLKAKADISTTLRVKTSGTFDCSSALSIPALRYEKMLPASGVTDIAIPPQPAGTTLRGMCSMGMYHFSVVFES